MNTMPRRTLIVDSSGVLHRCFHGYPSRKNLVNGQPREVAALGGYFDYIGRLRDEFACDRMVHVLDPEGGSAWRLGIYPAYKAGRPPTPEALVEQKQLLPIALEALGQAFIQVAGVESDDVIATLARQASEEGDLVLVASQDKDLLQLVDDRSTCMARYVSRGGGQSGIHQVFDEAEVLGQMGVRPDQIADYLAIVGDSTDNIPGVRGAGEKAARDWLGQYGNLAALMTACETIKGKRGECLRAARAEIWLWQKLTTLLVDVKNVAFPVVAEHDPGRDAAMRKALGTGKTFDAVFPAPQAPMGAAARRGPF